MDSSGPHLILHNFDKVHPLGVDKNPIRRNGRIKDQASIMVQVDDDAYKSQKEQLGKGSEQLEEVLCIEELWTVAYGGLEIDWKYKRKETSAIGWPGHWRSTGLPG